MQWGGNWGKIREKPVGGSVGPQGVPAKPEPAAEPPSPPQAGCPAGPRPAACRGLQGKLRILCRIEKDGCGLQRLARIGAWFFAGR